MNLGIHHSISSQVIPHFDQFIRLASSFRIIYADASILGPLHVLQFYPALMLHLVFGHSHHAGHVLYTMIKLVFLIHLPSHQLSTIHQSLSLQTLTISAPRSTHYPTPALRSIVILHLMMQSLLCLLFAHLHLSTLSHHIFLLSGLSYIHSLSTLVPPFPSHP